MEIIGITLITVPVLVALVPEIIRAHGVKNFILEIVNDIKNTV